MDHTDIRYEKKDGVAWVTINRPEVRNAFRTRTVAELTEAFEDARWDRTVGAGDKAFTSGGDQKELVRPYFEQGIFREVVAAIPTWAVDGVGENCRNSPMPR